MNDWLKLYFTLMERGYSTNDRLKFYFTMIEWDYNTNNQLKFYFTILLIILSIINIMVPITWLPSKIYFLIPWAIRKWKMCLVGNHIMIHAIYSALQLHKVISCYIYEFSHMGFPMVGSYWRSLQAHWKWWNQWEYSSTRSEN